MVVGQAQRHAGIDLDLAIVHAEGVLQRADAQYAGLGRIHHGGEGLDAQGAHVGHGERRAGQVIRVDLALLALLRQLLGSIGELLEGHLIGIEDGGHHQAAVGIHRHAQVDAPEVLHGLAVVDQVGVQGPVLGHHQRAGHHIHDDVVDADLLHAEGLTLGLVQRPGRLDLGGVVGDVVGQLGHRGQGRHHAASDDLADVAHRLGVAVVTGYAQRHRRGGCGSRGGGGRADQLAGVDQGLHVALDHAAVGAGANHLAEVGLLRVGQFLRAGRDFEVTHDHGGFGQLPGRCGGRGGSSGGRGGHGSLGAGTVGLGIRAGLADHAHVVKAGHVVAGFVEDSQQRAGHLGLRLEGGLVGLVGEQLVAHGHSVAHVHEPFGDDAALHGVALAGHDDRGAVAGDHGRGSRGGGVGSGGRGGRGGTARQRGVGVLARLSDHAHVLQAGHVVAFLIQHLQKGAGGLRLALEGGLVGLVGKQYIAHRDGVAGLFLPFGDDAAFHGISLSRHDDCNGH